MYKIDLGVLQIIGDALLDEGRCKNCEFYQNYQCKGNECYYTAVKRAHMSIVLDVVLDERYLPCKSCKQYDAPFGCAYNEYPICEQIYDNERIIF